MVTTRMQAEPDKSSKEEAEVLVEVDSGPKELHDHNNDTDEADSSNVDDDRAEHSTTKEDTCKSDICSQSSSETDVLSKCSEILPSSGSSSKKEESYEDDTNSIPLPDLLKMHHKLLVSGFAYGEATKKRAQENMKTARVKSISGNSEEDDDISKICSKKATLASEQDHQTPHTHKERITETIMSLSSSEVEFSKSTPGIPACLKDHQECIEVWFFMIYKEEASLKLRNPRLFADFKSVTPRMRAILLDWLMEVAEVYHLRRVTYYLSVDYFDRFLSIRPDIPKGLLQLVGITCLYIAAKHEEIYPPNLSEFSYVCDGACETSEIVSCELLILNSLGWEVILTTPSDWLNLYMQLHHKMSDVVRTKLNINLNSDFIFPQYSAYQFTRASQLMDLMSLDPGFLKFKYSTIAAAAMYFTHGEEITLAITGLTWDQLKPCTDYMNVYHKLLKDAPDPRLYSCLGNPHPNDPHSVGKLQSASAHNENYAFQTHVVSMDYFERGTIEGLREIEEKTTKVKQKREKVKKRAKDDDNPSINSCPDMENVSEIEPGQFIEELTKYEEESPLQSNNDENLLSLDEIFELIVRQKDDGNATTT